MADSVPRVFISYAAGDREIAVRIASELERLGVEPWSDESDLATGDFFGTGGPKDVRATDVVLVLLSPRSVHSSWAETALDEARLSELNDRAITVVPALVEECEIPPALRNRLHLDLREDMQAGIERLAQQLSVAPKIDFAVLSALQFEELAAVMVQDLGFRVEAQSRRGDVGYDALARDSEGIAWIVEAKHYGHARVDLAAVNQLVGTAAYNGVERALIVTSGQLTSAAREHIERVNDRSLVRIDVIDRTTLTALLLQRPQLAHRFFDRS